MKDMARDPLELVIFDCDGVLIDSEPIACQAMALALQAHGLPYDADAVHRDFTGGSGGETRRLLTQRHGPLDLDAIFADYEARMFPAFAAELRPMPGMAALLERLAVPRCVASNSGLDRLRRSLGLLPLWDQLAPHVYSAEMVARPKPAPDLPRHCLSVFGVAPERALFVDDSPHGVAAAVAAGIPAVGFITPGDTRPDRAGVLRAAGASHVVAGVPELASLLEGMTVLA